MKKKIAILSSIFLFLIFGYFYSYFASHIFYFDKVKADKYKNSHILSETEKIKILKILSQPYSFLGNGRQCFVFESVDQKYVIKFFNQNKFRVPCVLKKIPLLGVLEDFRIKKIVAKKKKRDFYFSSYNLAFNELKEETGLVFLHLNKTKNLFDKRIVIEDKNFKDHIIDLDKASFLIQRKTKPIFKHLTDEFEKQNFEKFENSISSFLNVVKRRVDKGLSDDDIDVKINYGFYKNKAIAFDAGRLSKNEKILSDKIYYKNEFRKSTKRLKKFLLENYPKYVSFFDNQFEKILDKKEKTKDLKNL